MNKPLELLKHHVSGAIEREEAEAITSMPRFTFKMGEFYTLEDIPEELRDMLMACHHQGCCDADCEAAVDSGCFFVDSAYKLKQHLRRVGIDEANLETMKDCMMYLLWMVAGDIQEHGESYLGE